MGSHVIETRRILDALRRLVQVLRLSAAKAEKAGVSGAQLFVLQELLKAPLSIAALAQRTHTDPSSVSTLVKRLEKQKLVVRAQAKDDARRAELRLTAKGRAIGAHATPAAQARLFSTIETLTAAERRGLANGLVALVGRMDLSGEAPLFFEEGKKK